MTKPQKPITVEFHFPLGGKNENWARDKQPPLTTPDCLNVWPYDRGGRARGAQRPGLAKLFTTPLGGTGAIYRQARRCQTDSLADVWVNEADIGAYPYTFKWAGDGLCYYITTSSPQSQSPGLIALGRTTVADCDHVSCNDGTNPPSYRQALPCSGIPTANAPYVPIAEVASYPYYFRWNEACWFLDGDEEITQTPGTVAVEEARAAITDCDDEDCGCEECGSFEWDTGDRAEHNDTETNGDPSFVKMSHEGVICTLGVPTVFFNIVTLDDFLILTHADDVVTQEYSGVAGDPVIIHLPPDAIIFQNLTGFVISGGSGVHPPTVQKTFIDGTNSYTFPAGTPGNPASGEVEDMEDGGFETRPATDGVTVAELTSRGWIDANGEFRFRFWHVVSGLGRAYIDAISCCEDATAPATEYLNVTFTGVSIASCGQVTLNQFGVNEQSWSTGLTAGAVGNFTLGTHRLRRTAPNGWISWLGGGGGSTVELGKMTAWGTTTCTTNLSNDGIWARIEFVNGFYKLWIGELGTNVPGDKTIFVGDSTCINGPYTNQNEAFDFDGGKFGHSGSALVESTT